MVITRAVSTVGSLVLVLATVGCGAEPRTRPNYTASATPSPGTGAGIETTPVGSRLQLGEAAVLRYEFDGVSTTLRVRPVSVEAGSREGVASVVSEILPRQADPAYVRVEYTNLAEQTLTFPQLNTGLDARGGNGEELRRVRPVQGQFAPCDEGDYNKNVAQGVTGMECAIFLVPPGERVTSLSWTDNRGEAPPVTWEVPAG